MQSVVFSLGEKSYAVSALAVQEILKHPRTTPLPQAPTHVVGMTDFRGKSIPVVHLGKLLNVAALDEGPKAIVLEDSELCAAFIVDDVTDVLDIPDDLIDVIPAGVSTAESIPHAVARLGEKMVIVVDPIKLVKQNQPTT